MVSGNSGCDIWIICYFFDAYFIPMCTVALPCHLYVFFLNFFNLSFQVKSQH